MLTWGVLPFWLLLVLAPGWRWTQRLVHSAAVPAVLAVTYVFLLFEAGGPMLEGEATTLPGVTAIFAHPAVVLLGWAHYIVFDLFVGAWEARDAMRLGISRWAVAPCLFFTLMLGPSGLLLYLVLRYALRRRFFLDESPAGEGAAA